MNKIVRFYNQKKKVLWITLLSIVAIISLIQILNNYYENKVKESSSAISTTTAYNTNNYSVVTDEVIGENIAKKSNNLIDSFFRYCNNGEFENAYNLLSEDCKKELYPTIEKFTKDYCSKIFSKKISYNSKLWITTQKKNTYRLEIMEDILATGQKDDMPTEDYYTIIDENGTYKLSINSYIGKEEIDKACSENGINIQIIAKQMYMEYEIYEIKVENNTGKTILFNPKQNMNSIYIQDENELKYIAFLNEIIDEDLLIQNSMSKTYNMKFNRGYKPNINIQKIVFTGIVVENSEDKISIEVEI